MTVVLLILSLTLAGLCALQTVGLAFLHALLGINRKRVTAARRQLAGAKYDLDFARDKLVACLERETLLEAELAKAKRELADIRRRHSVSWRGVLN